MLIIFKCTSATLISNKYNNLLCSCNVPVSCQDFTHLISLNLQGRNRITLNLHSTKPKDQAEVSCCLLLYSSSLLPACHTFSHSLSSCTAPTSTILCSAPGSYGHLFFNKVLLQRVFTGRNYQL